MRVLVTGGSGVLGRHVTRELVERGHYVTVASRNPRPIAGASTAPMDLGSGAGLEAVLGHDTVVHLASDPFHTMEVDIEGTRRLLARSAAAGVGHIVAISIVGVDDHPFPFYRVKVAMEHEVRSGDVPWTILRATQFHELLPRFVEMLPNIGVVPAPARVPLQTVDESVVARRLADLVDQGPSGRVADLGGPEVLEATEIVRRYLRRIGSHRPVVPFPLFGRWARAFRDGRMLVEEGGAGPTYDDHLASMDPPRRDPAATAMRLSALALLATAVWMAAAPASFHRNVAPFGALSTHFVRDLATFVVPICIGLLAGADRPSWRRPVLAIAGVQNLLHLVNHVVDIGNADPVFLGPVNAALLLGYQAVLWWAWRRSATASPVVAAARP